MGWMSFFNSPDARAVYFLAVTSYIWLFSSREHENFKLKTFFRKIGVFFDGIVFMILSQDSKGLSSKKKKKPDTEEDPDMLLKSEPPVMEKIIVFVRYVLCDKGYEGGGGLQSNRSYTRLNYFLVLIKGMAKATGTSKADHYHFIVVLLKEILCYIIR